MLATTDTSPLVCRLQPTLLLALSLLCLAASSDERAAGDGTAPTHAVGRIVAVLPPAFEDPDFGVAIPRALSVRREMEWCNWRATTYTVWLFELAVAR